MGARFVATANNLKKFIITYTHVGDGDEVGSAIKTLAGALGANTSVEILRLYETDVIRPENAKLWANAIEGMTSLNKLIVDKCDGMEKISTSAHVVGPGCEEPSRERVLE